MRTRACFSLCAIALLLLWTSPMSAKPRSGPALAGQGASAVAPKAPAKRPLSFDDFAKQRGVGDPQVSPDGKWIAYTVSAIDAEKDRRESDLWMIAWDGGDRVRLTSLPDGSESSPRWSPDGRYLAFIASRGDEEEKKKGGQVWLLDRRGGEAQKLTDIKGGVSEYEWSPDGKRLLLLADDWDPNSEPEKMDGWKRKTRPPIVVNRYHFKQDRDGYLGPLRSHLQIFDVETRKADVLTSGEWNEESPSWSPDGRSIAFISNREKDPDRVDNSDMFVIEAKPGAQARKLTTFIGPDGGRPAWSPDGQSIAYLQGDEPKYSAYNLYKLAVIPVAGGQPRVLTTALDRAVQSPIVWSPDSKTLTFVVQDDRITYVGRMPVSGGPIERLTTGRRTVSSLSPRRDGGFALMSATSSEPGEVYALENGSLRRLTHENDEWLAPIQLATTEDFTCKAKDGTEVHGLMFKPPAYTAGKKYATLLNIHGGPNGQDEHAFSFERQHDAPGGDAANKAFGAIDGVDDPAAAAAGFLAGALLAQQAVAGEGLFEPGGEIALGLAVGHGDRREIGLGLHGDVPAVIAESDLAGAAGEVAGHFEFPAVRVHGAYVPG